MARRTRNADEEMDKRQKTIKERQEKQKYEFVQHLKRNPNIEWASQRTGIHRSTIYRWIDEDRDFKKMLGYALKEGVSVMNDIMESLLLQAAKKGKIPAITFWLRNHHPAYLQGRFQEKLMDAIADVIRKDEEEENKLTHEEQEEHLEILRRWGIAPMDNQLKKKKKREE